MHRWWIFVVCVVVATSGHSAELVLPVVAWQTPGAGGSLWSSEIYVVNEGDAPGTVAWTRFLPSEPSDDCALTEIVQIDVDPWDTRLVPGRELAELLGCPDRVLGALMAESDGEIRITSRLANYRSDDPRCLYGDGLSGRSQTFHAVDTARLPGLGSLVTLGGLMWHVNSCGIDCFRSRVGFVNPTAEEIEAVIRPAGSWETDEISVDGELVTVPHTIILDSGSWILIEVNGPPLPWAACFPPSPATLTIELSGRAVVYGSVVDHFARDAWTLQPTPVPVTSPN